MIYGNEIALRRRFVKDYNLPINVVDSPYFEYYMDLYDWFPKKEYQSLVEEIDTKFGGNINLWLEEYSQIRDEIITKIENSEGYNLFNNLDLKTLKPSELTSMKLRNVPDLNIYNQSSIGKMFVSIDLKKANFQALKYINPSIVFNAETYEDMIDMFTDGRNEYFRTSKYTRQVIFGKLNPKRTITVEKYMMSMVYDTINECIEKVFAETKLVAYKSDELIYEVKDDNLDDIDVSLKNFEYLIEYGLGFNVRIELFKIGRIECKNHNGITVDCYIRHNLITGKEELKSCSQIFYPQFYKIWKDIRANCYDYAFLAEGQIAHFEFPLELVNIYR